MVKVLPEPVTPSSTWVCSPWRAVADQLGDRRRLVARRLIVGDEPEFPAAFGLFRPLRPVGDEVPPRIRLVEAGPDRDRHGFYMVIRAPPR